MARYSLQGSDDIVDASIDIASHDANDLDMSDVSEESHIDEGSIADNASEVDNTSNAGDDSFNGAGLVVDELSDADSEESEKDSDEEATDDDDDEDKSTDEEVSEDEEEEDPAAKAAADLTIDLELFTPFSRLPTELRSMILEEALESAVVPRTIMISESMAPNGRFIYTAKYDPPYPTLCADALAVLKLRYGYTTIKPKALFNRSQKSILIHPENDTFTFDLWATEICSFMLSLPEEDQCNVRKIEYEFNDQSYLDMFEFPSWDGYVLLFFPRLLSITFLEDRRNRHEMRKEPGRERTMEGCLAALGEGEDWDVPDVDFKLDYSERRYRR